MDDLGATGAGFHEAFSDVESVRKYWSLLSDDEKALAINLVRQVGAQLTLAQAFLHPLHFRVALPGVTSASIEQLRAAGLLVLAAADELAGGGEDSR